MKTFREVLIILIAGAILGFAANKISPRGIPLVRDDSDRFKIDSTSLSKEKSKTERKYTKEGFVKPQNIPVELAKQLFDEGAVFIDGRESNEFTEGRIKGAKNIPYKEFKDHSQR